MIKFGHKKGTYHENATSQGKGKRARLEIRQDKKRKADLIRAIQIEEGNTSCFQAEVSDCKETDCCWRNDCQGWVG